MSAEVSVVRVPLTADIDIAARSGYFLQVSLIVISLLLQGFFAKSEHLIWQCCTILADVIMKGNASYVVSSFMLCDLVLFILFCCCFFV